MWKSNFELKLLQLHPNAFYFHVGFYFRYVLLAKTQRVAITAGICYW